MDDSIGDLIVTPYITNLSGKDSNRCQMISGPTCFYVTFCLLLEEASEGGVSTFAIIFRIRFLTLVC